jgi:hypothetical protein
MNRAIFNLIVLCSITACASGPTIEQLRVSSSKTVIGRITDRFDMAAIPNQEGPIAGAGALGVLISQHRGIPRHYRYWVLSADGTLYAYHSTETYPVGDCLRIYVPKEVETNRTWFLAETAAETADGCK